MRTLCIFTMILSLFAAPSASPAGKLAIWNCYLNSTLTGDPGFFMQYGRDSWKGTGELVCTYISARVSRPVRLTFNSNGSSFGAGTDSQIDIQVSLSTSAMARAVRVFGPVSDSAPDLNVMWHIETGATAADILIKLDGSKPELKRSLARGTLFIR